MINRTFVKKTKKNIETHLFMFIITLMSSSLLIDMSSVSVYFILINNSSSYG